MGEGQTTSPDDDPYAQAYWGPRAATAAEAADRITSCLRLLHRADRRLRPWLVTHRRHRHEFLVDAANPDVRELAEYLASHGLIREQSHPYRQIPQLGFHAHMQLQGRSRIFAGARFRIGTTAPRLGNNAHLDVRHSRCSQVRILEILVETFGPTAGFVSAHRFYDERVLRRAWACFGEVEPVDPAAGLVLRRTRAGPIQTVPVSQIGNPDSSFAVSGY